MPPMVRTLSHSISPHSTVPAASRISETWMVSLVCRFHFFQFRPFCCSTITTGKPRLPRKTPSISGTRIHRSVSYGTMPSECGVNPALLNDEIA